MRYAIIGLVLLFGCATAGNIGVDALQDKLDESKTALSSCEAAREAEKLTAEGACLEQMKEFGTYCGNLIRQEQERIANACIEELRRQAKDCRGTL